MKGPQRRRRRGLREASVGAPDRQQQQHQQSKEKKVSLHTYHSLYLKARCIVVDDDDHEGYIYYYIEFTKYT